MKITSYSSVLSEIRKKSPQGKSELSEETGNEEQGAENQQVLVSVMTL